jgi:hypothetical protein
VHGIFSSRNYKPWLVEKEMQIMQSIFPDSSGIKVEIKTKKKIKQHTI